MEVPEAKRNIFPDNRRLGGLRRSWFELSAKGTTLVWCNRCAKLVWTTHLELRSKPKFPTEWGIFLTWFFLSVFLCRITSFSTHIISLLLNNRTLNWCTGFPKLGSSGDIHPKITMLIYVCVLTFFPGFILPQFYLCKFQCDLFSICCSKQ